MMPELIHMPGIGDAGGEGGGVADSTRAVLCKSSDLSDQSARKIFVRKVYAVMTQQLFFTLSSILIFETTPSIKSWAIRNTWIVVLAATLFVLYLILLMSVNEIFRQEQPLIYCVIYSVFGILTLLQSFLLGFASCLMESKVIMMTTGILMILCLAITLFGFQNTWEYTFTSGSLVCITVVALLFGILTLTVPGIQTQKWSSLSAVIFFFYTMLNIHLMMDGGHKYSFTAKSYFFAALSFYFDFFNIIIFTLKIFFGKY